MKLTSLLVVLCLAAPALAQTPTRTKASIETDEIRKARDLYARALMDRDKALVELARALRDVPRGSAAETSLAPVRAALISHQQSKPTPKTLATPGLRALFPAMAAFDATPPDPSTLRVRESMRRVRKMQLDARNAGADYTVRVTRTIQRVTGTKGMLVVAPRAAKRPALASRGTVDSGMYQEGAATTPTGTSDPSLLQTNPPFDVGSYQESLAIADPTVTTEPYGGGLPALGALVQESAAAGTWVSSLQGDASVEPLSSNAVAALVNLSPELYAMYTEGTSPESPTDSWTYTEPGVVQAVAPDCQDPEGLALTSIYGVCGKTPTQLQILASLMKGKGCWARLYQEPDYQGASAVVSLARPEISDLAALRLDNQISSIRLITRDCPGGGVRLFEAGAFVGSLGDVTASTPRLGDAVNEKASSVRLLPKR
jgi:hypothetical protein